MITIRKKLTKKRTELTPSNIETWQTLLLEKNIMAPNIDGMCYFKLLVLEIDTFTQQFQCYRMNIHANLLNHEPRYVIESILHFLQSSMTFPPNEKFQLYDETALCLSNLTHGLLIWRFVSLYIRCHKKKGQVGVSPFLYFQKQMAISQTYVGKWQDEDKEIMKTPCLALFLIEDQGMTRERKRVYLRECLGEFLFPFS